MLEFEHTDETRPNKTDPKDVQNQILDQAERKAKLSVEIAYAKPDEKRPADVVEAKVAHEAVDHMIGMTRDAAEWAERLHMGFMTGENTRGFGALIPGLEPDTQVKIVDGFPHLKYKNKIDRIGFPDTVSPEERKARYERGIETGFTAGIKALVPDPEASKTLTSVYGWVDGDFQAVAPLEEPFKTVLPHATLSQIPYYDVFEKQVRPALIVNVKRAPGNKDLRK